MTLMAPLLAGGRVRTMERFNPLRALDLLEAGGISFLVGVPAMYAGLLAALQRRAKRFSSASLATCICGGAPLSSELQDRWAETTGVELRQGYGLTEASPVCLYNRPSLPNRRGTLGVPFPDVRVTIRDPSTSAELPAGSEGEICVAGENVFMGYVQRGEVGLQVRSGWLHSGDLGHAGADGWVTFTGLLKDMFTHSGFNIYPRELEQAVSGMPGVRAVRVRAIQDQLREHDIALDVVGAVERDAVRAWCAARLASYKRPAVHQCFTPPEAPRPTIVRSVPSRSSNVPASIASMNAATTSGSNCVPDVLAQLVDRASREQCRRDRAGRSSSHRTRRRRDDARLERNLVAARADRACRGRRSARDASARCSSACGVSPSSGARMRQPSTGCVMMCSYSSGGERAGLFSTSSRTPILPMSCTCPPSSIWRSISPSSPSSRAMHAE